METKKKTLASALTGVTMLVGGAEVAVAGFVTQSQLSQGISTSDSSASSSLEFNLFDPTLGTLQQVDISVRGVDYAIQYDPFFGEVSGTATYTSDFTVDFSNASGAPFSNPWFTDTLSVSVDCGQQTEVIVCDTATNSPPSEGTLFQTLPYASNLNDFIGGGTFDVSFGFANVEYIGLQSNFDIFNEGSPLNWSSGGSVSISYTYESNPVPIPGTLALTATGIAALGFLNRRRKKQKV